MARKDVSEQYRQHIDDSCQRKQNIIKHFHFKRSVKGHKKQRYGKMDRKFKEKHLIARPVARSALPMMA
jgi:hypothetical protein